MFAGGGNSNEEPMNPYSNVKADVAGYGYGPPGTGAPGPQDQEMGYSQNPAASSSYAGMATPGNAQPPSNFNNDDATKAGSQAAYLNRPSTINPMNLIWFAAACSVMFGSTISFFSKLFSLEWVDALQMGFLSIFGLLLAVLDTPLFNQVAIVGEMRVGIGKYIAALQRVTGKGATYIFLGSASFMAVRPPSSLAVRVIAALIGVFVVLVGCFSLYIAILKSKNLNLVRLELRKEPMSLKQMYDTYAKMNPTAGITQEEFKKMTPYARGVSFEQADIKLIFNALSTNPRRDVISLEDLTSWVNGDMMAFI